MKTKNGLKEFLNIGGQIKEMRLLRGISQKDFAKSLGIPVSTYSNYENGNRMPDLETIKKICDALYMDFESLLFVTPIDDIYEDGNLSNKHKALLTTRAINFERTKIGIEENAIHQEPPILKKYNKLNNMGKIKVEAYTDGLLENPNYLLQSEDEEIRFAAFQEGIPYRVESEDDDDTTT